MTAIKRDFTVEQGATFYFTFQCIVGVYDEETESVEPGGPKNLAGCIFRMQVRPNQQDAPLLSVSNAVDSPAGADESGFIFGVAPADPDDAVPVLTNGWVRLRITDDDTDNFTKKRSKYDIEMEEPSGRVLRLYQGVVTTDPNITQEVPEDPPVEE